MRGYYAAPLHGVTWFEANRSEMQETLRNG